jgi:hypothetical protein
MMGGVLGAFLVPALGLAPGIAGILTVIVGPLAPLLAPFIGLLSIPLAILVGGLALLVVTVMAYAVSAVSLLGAVPVAGVIPTNPFELISRGILLGLTTAANALTISILTGLPMLTTAVVVVGFLTTIPPVAASRMFFQPILGLLSWFMPMTWLIMPLGVMLFVLNLPFALAQSGIGALRFDFSTATFETQGGALVNFLFSLSPLPGAAGFNLGNFTFLSLAPGGTPSTASFVAANLSSHEVGHTVTVAAFGGFFGLINAVDENIPPLARGTAAYGEVLPESHSFNRGVAALPMW